MRIHASQTRMHSKGVTYDALQTIEAEEFSVGDMNVECMNCGAEFFQDEWVKGNPEGVFNTCCLKGKLHMNDPFQDFPAKLRELFERNCRGLYRNFHECIRQFNSAFAFGSMKAQTVNFNNYGPYCYKIHGQVYHTVNLALHPDDYEPPSFAQLFIIDTAEATAHRMAFPANKECNEHLMAELDHILMPISPYRGSLMMLKEVEEEQAHLAARMGKDPPQLKLLFDIQEHTDRRLLNMPRANEIAAVFVVNQNGELPQNEGISVHLRGKQLKRISKLDRRIDSMLYPLFFPTGEGGWHLRLRTSTDKKVTMEQYYRYLLARRNESFFNPIHYGGKKPKGT